MARPRRVTRQNMERRLHAGSESTRKCVIRDVSNKPLPLGKNGQPNMDPRGLWTSLG